jgi:glyoxylase-like metal-dependent hydrolase (beta-lactamase superfamily II)
MIRYLVSATLIGALLSVAFASPQQQDFSSVEVKASPVAGNVHMLMGRGGNIGVSVGPDGILIVDDQFAPLADKIRAALKGLGEGKLRFLLNTHWHGDHTGSNAVFGKEATIIAHDNVRKRLESGMSASDRTVAPAAKDALPVITFDKSLTVHFNGEEIRAIHYPKGHTDGDSIIFFTKSNVVHMGDDFFNGMFPFIDLASGGDVEGYVKNIGDVIPKIPAGAKIIPGHGPLATIDDLKAFHAMLLETVDVVRKQMLAGKTLDDIKKAGMPDKYKSWGAGFVPTDRWITTIHTGLSSK